MTITNSKSIPFFKEQITRGMWYVVRLVLRGVRRVCTWSSRGREGDKGLLFVLLCFVFFFLTRCLCCCA